MADGSRVSSQRIQQDASLTWARWTVPSIADALFVAILCMLVSTVLSVRLLGDAGIGWHIRAGQWILSNHALPSQVDPFSASFLKPWLDWEWLYDICVGQLESWCGLNGVVWLNAVLISATFAWLFQILLRRETNLFAALVLWLLAISASSIHFLARPHVVSWLLTLAFFWILDSTETRTDSTPLQRRQLWLLPVLMVIWGNVHGGFLLGFVLLGIFWLGTAWDAYRARQDRLEEVLQKISAMRRLRDLTWIGVASAMASLVNPYGWKLHAHIFSYLTNRFLMDHIDEFQSPNFHGVAQKCFLVLLLITFAAVVVRGRKLRVSSALIVLFALYSGLYASRNIPIAAILLAIIIGPLFTGFDLRFSGRMAAVDSRAKGHAWPVLCVICTFAVAANGVQLGSHRLMDAHFDAHRMPVGAANFLADSDIHGPILSLDYWGGYFIYRLSPRNRIVIDDRHDFYGEVFLRSYLKTVHVEPGWQEFLDQRAACVVLPRSAALSAILAKTPDWHAIYGDDVSVVFTRAGNLTGDSNGSLTR